MSNELPIFEELVASEAAIRAQQIAAKHSFVAINPPVPTAPDGTPLDIKQPLVTVSTLNMDGGENKEAIAASLFDHYVKIYDYQFQDSSQHKKKDESGKHYNARHLTENEKGVIQKIFAEFVDRHYDNHGNLTLTSEEAPAALAQLYERIKGDDVMLTHATMALGVLLVELSQGEKWKGNEEKKIPGITPRGIDFTRGLRQQNIEDRIRDAIHAERPQTESSPYIPPPGEQHIEKIAGLDFPVKMVDGPPCSPASMRAPRRIRASIS